ncbi:MAG: hypothetical protein LBU58_08795 [Clostridiales bacterium]|jgi:hypothetical protein|nr:hypothetical protein [Clostridiales bacterium]
MNAKQSAGANGGARDSAPGRANNGGYGTALGGSLMGGADADGQNGGQPVSKKEIAVLRELAKQYAQIAALPVMEKTRRRMIENNGLTPGRPPVVLFELPWHELNADGKLTLVCEHPFAREMEQRFRRTLFQWEYFPGDLLVENAFLIPRAYMSTGNGMSVVEQQRVTDENNNIYSHGYIDQLETEADLEKFQMPDVTAYPERDRANVALAEEILDGILRVGLRGHDIYHAPWDQIARYRSVTAILFDLYDRPEHLHAIMELYTRAAISEFEQMERLGLLEYRNPYLHCTPALTDDLPAKDHVAGEAPRFADVWFRSMAQMFAEVSPAMHEEFDLLYGKRLADRCALTYYGCCEPLQTKIPILKKTFPNLRKIGVTPWADEERSAELIGRDFVYARKPNPANVAVAADADVIRAETAKTAEICLKYGCPYELVLKDISTVSYRLENLVIWERTVRETLDRFYA